MQVGVRNVHGLVETKLFSFINSGISDVIQNSKTAIQFKSEKQMRS